MWYWSLRLRWWVLPEWVGSKPNGCPVCLTLLWRHNLHSEVAGKHCGSLGFSVCHDDSAFGAVAGMPWVSPGGAVHAGSHCCGVFLCPSRHFLPALWLGMYSCARHPGVLLVFWVHRPSSWILISSCKIRSEGLLFRSGRMSQYLWAFW